MKKEIQPPPPPKEGYCLNRGDVAKDFILLFVFMVSVMMLVRLVSDKCV